MEDRENTRAAVPGSKPRAAAALTADVVARGRQRKQAYGEAGLWRGAALPPPEEAPVRMVLPPVRGRRAERDERSEEAEQPKQEELRLAELADAPEAAASDAAADERSKDMGDVAFYLVGAALVGAAVYLLSMLFL